MRYDWLVYNDKQSDILRLYPSGHSTFVRILTFPQALSENMNQSLPLTVEFT